ncbi:MAG: pitrilysin family protein [Clostridia bacterium]
MLAFNGCRVIAFETAHFKTNSISFNLIQDLGQATATQNALLMKVLRRGCLQYKSSKEIAIALESSFGATLSVKIEKAGDTQITGFVCSFPADEFVGERLTNQLVALLLSLIFEPLQEGAGFRTDYFDQEKAVLREEIEGQKDDKKTYALQRCVELMFPGEPYQYNELGDLEQLDNITNEGLFAHYQETLRKAQMVVFLSGRFHENNIDEFSILLKQKIQKIRRTIETKNLANTTLKVRLAPGDAGAPSLQEFVEALDVTQGKLTIGFTTETPPSTAEYVSLMVANSIFGGGMHSKLFTEVREKESLAYYSMSMMDKYKGVIFVTAGIDAQNKEKTQSLILAQLEKIQNGEISDFELSAARKALINSLRSLGDSQLSVQAFHFGQLLAGSTFSIADLIAQISTVTSAQVIAAAQRIKPHTLYFMTGNEGLEVAP